MFNIIKSIKGNIGIAIVISLIAVLSGVSLASVAFRDSLSFRYQLDGIQQFHLLRSEVGRGRLLAGHLDTVPTPPTQTVLPTRSVTVEFGTNKTVYNARTKLTISDFGEEGSGYHIRSLISAIRGDGRLAHPDQISPVKRYGENRIQSLQTIALFHYFTDIDRWLNDLICNIRFIGEDVIHGRVHSNTNICINFTSYGSWPTFYGLVTTGGNIGVQPGGGTNFPEEEIFLGGLIEEYPRIEFEPTAELVRERSVYNFGRSERDDAFLYVTVDGTSYEAMLAEIEVDENPVEWIEGYNQFTIYNSYPPYGPVGTEIGVNRIPKKDTVWTELSPGNLYNNSMFVPMELWISGNFGGRQTWASSHDIYLKDDLTYVNTTPGQRPDGIDDEGNRTNPVNQSDYLGIISEDCIRIQYGHYHPEDSVRVKPNTESIYMYGAYCSVGQGSPNEPWYDGVITFQYQNPKGSTPAQYWRGEFFKNIDLHIWHYPTSNMNPWPPGWDYPWYNPLWPEPGPLWNVLGYPSSTPNPHGADGIVRQRGTIYLFGSFAQRRRGNVGISAGGVVTYIWDIDNILQPHNMPARGVVPPGTTGYFKGYTTDLRFETTGPPNFPIIRFEGYDTDELRDLGYATLGWVFKNPPDNF